MLRELATSLCAILSASLVAGQYHFPTVTTDTAPNSECPPENQMKVIRYEVSHNVSKILADKFNNYTIPECGGSGWRRVGFLDMTDPDQTCPDAWRLYQDDSVRACGRQESTTASCDSIVYGTNQYEYSEVCGRIIGYQFASPDGLYVPQHMRDIDSAYVDGISITHGTPRQHIWTLFAGVREFQFGCCRTSYSVASFIENSYFCDTGNPTNAPWRDVYFADNPLWDGIAGCPSNNSCCAPHTGPWFHADLTGCTEDTIEVRICGSEPSSNENTPLKLVEIYVRK